MVVLNIKATATYKTTYFEEKKIHRLSLDSDSLTFAALIAELTPLFPSAFRRRSSWRSDEEVAMVEYSDDDGDLV